MPRPARETALYAGGDRPAGRVCTRMPAGAGCRPMIAPSYHREAELLTEWYCPAVGIELDRDGYRAAWDAVLDAVAGRRRAGARCCATIMPRISC